MYYAKINWYDGEEDRLCFVFIPADGWNEAMQKISNEFKWINSIEMTEVLPDKCGMVYVPEDVVDKVMKANLDYDPDEVFT